MRNAHTRPVIGIAPGDKDLPRQVTQKEGEFFSQDGRQFGHDVVSTRPQRPLQGLNAALVLPETQHDPIAARQILKLPPLRSLVSHDFYSMVRGSRQAQTLKGFYF